jgi:mono/diheme cytochrome c family protein
MAVRRGVRLLVPLVLGLMLGQLGISAAQDQAKPKKLNPYTGNPEVIREGKRLYIYFGCSSCHGVGGGGGMGVPLLDDEWKFGSDDETLFRLLKGKIPEQTMPSFEEDMEDDQAWKILAYVRSLYKGDPSEINW